jgi:phosphoglycerate kinase
MKFSTLDSLACKGKTVFVRVDFNVSFDEQGGIRDTARITAALPTIHELQSMGARIILASHLGRPKGKRDSSYSLMPVAAKLAELLGQDVVMPEDCVGMAVKKLASELREGQVMLLENLRFYAEEEANDEAFAHKLADLADVYVNDAFGTMHRAHASTVGMVKFFQSKAIGRLVEKEVQFLSKLLYEPERPYVVILGGAKVSDKIAVIENLMNIANVFIIGGGMAYTFLKAQGVDVGKSLVEEGKLATAKRILERAEHKGIEILLPEDSVIAEHFDAGAVHRVAKNGDKWGDWMALDIGPQSQAHFAQVVSSGKTVFWNGPMGVYEFAAYQEGTNVIAKAMAASGATTIVGGGDSLAAIRKSGVADQLTHLSTGGGASLEFLEGKVLPGLQAIAEK